MNNNIFQAIPTQWKGVLYRSRLEARYAVLFECLNIKYNYERGKTRVLLKNGIVVDYQPDFVIPEIECNEHFPLPLYVEVKGADSYESISIPERMKIEAFAENHSLIVLGNLPYRASEFFQKPDALFSYKFINGSAVSCFFNAYNGVPRLVDRLNIQQYSRELDEALYFAIHAKFDEPEEVDEWMTNF